MLLFLLFYWRPQHPRGGAYLRLLGWPTHDKLPSSLCETSTRRKYNLRWNLDWKLIWVNHHWIETSGNSQDKFAMSWLIDHDVSPCGKVNATKNTRRVLIEKNSSFSFQSMSKLGPLLCWSPRCESNSRRTHTRLHRNVDTETEKTFRNATFLSVSSISNSYGNNADPNL